MATNNRSPYLGSILIAFSLNGVLGCGAMESGPMEAKSHEHHHLHATDVEHDHEHLSFESGTHTHDHTHKEQ